MSLSSIKPILPYISDNERDLHQLIKTAADTGVNYVIVDLLNFRGETRDRFMTFLSKYNSDLIPKYEILYQTQYCDKHNTKEKRRKTNKLIKKHQVDNYDKMYSYRIKDMAE